MYSYVCMYVFICRHISINLHACMYIWGHINIYLYNKMYVFICVHIRRSKNARTYNIELSGTMTDTKWAKFVLLYTTLSQLKLLPTLHHISRQWPRRRCPACLIASSFQHSSVASDWRSRRGSWGHSSAATVIVDYTCIVTRRVMQCSSKASQRPQIASLNY